jgi:thioredoxin-related protein
MKSASFFVVLALMVGTWLTPSHLQAQTRKGVVFFQGSHADLIKAAQRSGKPYFVDCYAEWCGPCKLLNKTTFADPTVGEYVNTNMLAYKLDCEKGEGPELCKLWKIQGYPSILVFGPDGKRIGLIYGYVDSPTFLAELKRILPKASGTKTGQKSAPAFDFDGQRQIKREQLQATEQQLREGSWKTLAPILNHADSLGRVRDEFGFGDLLKQLAREPQQSRTLVQLHYYRARQQWDKFQETVNQAMEAQQLSAATLHWAAGQWLMQEEIPAQTLRWVNAALALEPTAQVTETKAWLYILRNEPALAADALAKISKKERSETQEAFYQWLTSRAETARNTP